MDDQGKHEEAIAHLSQALFIRPDYAKAHNNLGMVYYKTGRLDDAIKEFETALDLNPRFSGAKRNLGEVLKAKRDEEGYD